MTSQLTNVTPETERDRYGRPLILHPDGTGRKIAYTRATTVAGAIDDLNGLIRWKVGRAVLGIVDRPDLLLSAAAHRDDKQQLYRICDDALEAGGQSTAATIGTALHKITEQIDRGTTPAGIPADYLPDITAYMQATADLHPLHIEEMVVNDDLGIAGTPDMIVTYDGGNYIADKKTGSIDYPHKMAAQLAIYAHSMLYNPSTGERTPLPAVNGDEGIIIHLPAGQGVCTLHYIDLKAGWEAVQLAVDVRTWRKRQGLLTPVPPLNGGFAEATRHLTEGGLITGTSDDIPASITAGETIVDALTTKIGHATSLERLTELWQTNRDAWKPGHTAAAKTRKDQLTK